ncbi:MAG: cytochrome c, partial [Myxococcales bacterium]|nr:cytochrome c [Myxococcales bacterium]
LLMGLLALGCSEAPLLPWLAEAPPDLGDGLTTGAELRAQATLVLVREPVSGALKLLVAAPLTVARPAATAPGASTVLACLDGYRVTLRADQIRQASPWLAWAEWGTTTFSVTDAAGKAIPLGPYYLVWDVSDRGAERPWPFQVHRLEGLTTPAYGPITPAAGVAAPVTEGFALYEGHCAKCHAIGGVGGDLGPELGCPAGVTTYWQRAALARWIAEPAALRRGARMPPSGLGAADIEAVIRYLEHMATALDCGAR